MMLAFEHFVGIQRWGQGLLRQEAPASIKQAETVLFLSHSTCGPILLMRAVAPCHCALFAGLLA